MSIPTKDHKTFVYKSVEEARLPSPLAAFPGDLDKVKATRKGRNRTDPVATHRRHLGAQRRQTLRPVNAERKDDMR